MRARDVDDALVMSECRKGELNIEKEEHGHSRTEIERVGKMLTEAVGHSSST